MDENCEEYAILAAQVTTILEHVSELTRRQLKAFQEQNQTEFMGSIRTWKMPWGKRSAVSALCGNTKPTIIASNSALVLQNRLRQPSAQR